MNFPLYINNINSGNYRIFLWLNVFPVFRNPGAITNKSVTG